MQTLGQVFREAREQKKATMSEAAAATRMKTSHVVALENEDFAKFGVPIYAKGFIRLYAEYLGLDPAPLVREYVERFVTVPRPPISPESTSRWLHKKNPPSPALAPTVSYEAVPAAEPAAPPPAAASGSKVVSNLASASAAIDAGARPAPGAVPRFTPASTARPQPPPKPAAPAAPEDRLQPELRFDAPRPAPVRKPAPAAPVAPAPQRELPFVPPPDSAAAEPTMLVRGSRVDFSQLRTYSIRAVAALIVAGALCGVVQGVHSCRRAKPVVAAPPALPPGVKSVVVEEPPAPFLDLEPAPAAGARRP